MFGFIFFGIVMVVVVAALVSTLAAKEDEGMFAYFFFSLIVGGAVLFFYSMGLIEITQGHPQELNSIHLESRVIVEVIHETNVAGNHLVVIRGPEMTENSWRIFSTKSKELFGLGYKTTECNPNDCKLSPVSFTPSDQPPAKVQE